MMNKTLIAFAFFTISLHVFLNGQAVGGNQAGQAIPQAVEAAKLGPGPVAGDVNLFTGGLGINYSFGNVATLSGLSFPIELNWESPSLAGFDADPLSGVPYGEGWSLANASITMETYAWDWMPNELPIDLQQGIRYTPEEARAIGQLYYSNVRINLPGGISGRLVFKYPDPHDLSSAIYVLEGFDSYVEARFNGNTWYVHMPDGTIFDFGFAQWSWRNPSQESAWLSQIDLGSVLPKNQPVRWHLSEISNPNHANGQKIRFDYQAFGKQEVHHELGQYKVKQKIGQGEITSLTIVTQTMIDNANGIGQPIRHPNGQPAQAGDTLLVMSKGIDWLPVYRDILLVAVTAFDAQGGTFSKAELKYKSWRPEVELANDQDRLQAGHFLVLSDPQVLRLDSLYSQKTIWWTGRDTTLSRTYHGLRPNQPNTPFSTQWQRYMHPRAYQHPIAAQLRPNHPRNPYAIRINQAPGMPDAWYYITQKDANGIDTWLDFKHSVLESPRIDVEDMVPGDWYEVRTLIKAPQVLSPDMNFDVRVATGLPDNSAIHQALGATQPNYYQSGNLKYKLAIENSQPSVYGSPTPLGYWENGIPLLSTNRDIVKWNPAYSNQGNWLTTRNSFRLPNLPEVFGGISVQVGPGADNMRHDQPDEFGYGYPFYYQNLDAQGYPIDSFSLAFGSWFGSGAPLEPLWRTDRFNMLKNGASLIDKGQHGARWYHWFLPYDVTFNAYNLGIMGANQPTAVTRETLKANNQWTSSSFTFTDNSIRDAHETPEDAQLFNVELVRISKNPWMLDSVVFYTMSGDYETGLKPVSAFKLVYDLAQVPVLQNVNRNADTAFLSLVNEYRIRNSDTLMRNVMRLVEVRRMGADTTGYVNTQNPGITRFGYLKDNVSTIAIQEAVLIDRVWSELGGKTRYVYDFNNIDTLHLNHNPIGLSADMSAELIGPGTIVEVRVPIKQRLVEDANGVQSTDYQYADKIVMSRTTAISGHIRRGWNDISNAHTRRGYRKVTVLAPQLAGATGRAKVEYFFRSAKATHADSLLFGRLIETRNYDDQGRLIAREQTDYAAHQAYANGQSFKPIPLYSSGHTISTSYKAILPYDAAFVFGKLDARWMNSWFTYRRETRNTDFDPLTGDSIQQRTQYSYFDWNWKTGRTDTDGDYTELYQDGQAWNFGVQPWFDSIPGNSPQFMYPQEPSWQPARVTSTTQGRPGAFDQKNYYYLWDIGPFLENGNQLAMRFEGSHRPYWLSQRYHIRTVVTEERTTTYDGNEDHPAVALSTYFDYGVFREVGGDFVQFYDSTNYGSYCDPGGGGPLETDRQAVVSCFGVGEKVDVEDAVAELLDDPRYIHDSDGTWWLMPVTNFSAVTLSAAMATANSQDPLALGIDTTGCAAGHIATLDGKAGYFGIFQLAGAGQLPAEDIAPVTRNYGKDAAIDTLTEESKEKAAIIAIAPHQHPENPDHLCDLVHGYENDSTFNAKLKEPADSSASAGLIGARQKFIDLLDWQFFLQAVYTQADTVPNEYLSNGYAHNPAFMSPHNVWDTVEVGVVWQATGYRYIFAPPFPTIRTYKVHARNMHGQVIDESDSRHLHTLYEYPKARFRFWFDLCSNAHTSIERARFGLPESVTVTDFGLIEQVTHFRYTPNNLLAGITAPNGEITTFNFDTDSRLHTTDLNYQTRTLHNYAHWAGDTLQNWQTRTGMNWTESRLYSGPGVIYTRDYLDPVGRSAQSLMATKSNYGGWHKRFGGEATRDAWSRQVAEGKSWHKQAQPNLDFDPSVPSLPESQAKLEASGKSRTLRAVAPGVSITSSQADVYAYSIINVSTYQAETGVDWAIVRSQFPGLPSPGSPGSNGTNIRLYKALVTDGDGRKRATYSDAGGRKLADLAWEDLPASNAGRVLTTWEYDAQGRICRTVAPNFLETTTAYNVLGWPYRAVSPDAGETRMLYNQAGDLVYAQDARLRAQGRFDAWDHDRLGRVVSQSELNLGVVNVHNNWTWTPLTYKDTLGVAFRPLMTIVDAFARVPSDKNCADSVFTANFDDKAWPCVSYPESSERIVSEILYDFRADTAISATGYPDAVNGGAAHARSPLPGEEHYKLSFWTGAQQGGLLGRVSLSRSYTPEGDLAEISYYGYDEEGRNKWVARQSVRPDGLGRAVHMVHYKDYLLNGVPQRMEVDLEADGIEDWAELHHHDEWGRLQFVGLDRGTGAVDLVGRYVYDDEVYPSSSGAAASGRVISEIHYASGKPCGTVVYPAGYNGNWILNAYEAIDTVQTAFDSRERLKSIRSRFFDFDLFHDAENPNNAPGVAALTGPQVVNWTQNHAGGINGWRARYKPGTAATTQGSLPSNAEGWNGATHYGFTFDGMGRLVEADASVLAQPFGGSSSGWGAGGNFGGAMYATRPAFYGDERYAYDKAGNLTGLQRYHFYRPNQAVPTSMIGDNWNYDYFAGTNRLRRLTGNGFAPTYFAYDANGNMISDARRGITVDAIDGAGLVTKMHVSNGGTSTDSVAYVYGSGGRIWKQAAGRMEHYLRGAGGEVLGIHRYADTLWTASIHGLGMLAEFELAAAVPDSSEEDTLEGGPGTGRYGHPGQPSKPSNGVKESLVRDALIVAGTAVLDHATRPRRTEGRQVLQQQQQLRPWIAAAAALGETVVELVRDRKHKRLIKSKVPPSPPRDNARRSDGSKSAPIKFFVKDHLGNLRVSYLASLDSSTCAARCTLVGLLDYTPYGKVLRAWQNPQITGVGRDGKERVQTTLHERDWESGWDYRGARFYDADLGRFLSVDPLAGQFPGWSPYNYVLGNPVGLTDLTGMAPDGGGGEDPWYIRNARAAQRATGGTLTKESENRYRLEFLYNGIAHNVLFERDGMYDQDYFAPPPNISVETRFRRWLEELGGCICEYGLPDDHPMVVAGKEGGAIVYQAYAFGSLFELMSGREGPKPESGYGKAGVFLMPGGAFGKGVKGAKAINAIDAAQDVRKSVTVITKTDPKMLKLAKETFDGNKALSIEANNLMAQVVKGNLNPGKGTRFIANGIFEFRGENARIYFRNATDGIEIIGYSSKKNQDQVIQRIREVYK